ncbi:unnamed protein product [Pleuronectes platessa]|uniref:Uncharacterized protein n=1 Tax=Pleuronectes platessa TaxID=8262 RepID=A0A9N7Y8F9_PLEPL|nr:unnamed protein product [Pleuronectes platessa]
MKAQFDHSLLATSATATERERAWRRKTPITASKATAVASKQQGCAASEQAQYGNVVKWPTGMSSRIGGYRLAGCRISGLRNRKLTQPFGCSPNWLCAVDRMLTEPIAKTGSASSPLSKADIRLAVTSVHYQDSASVRSKATVATLKWQVKRQVLHTWCRAI